MTPYRLGFINDDPSSFDTTWDTIDLTIDCLFTIDIILTFFFAYYDDEFTIVDSKSVRTLFS